MRANFPRPGAMRLPRPADVKVRIVRPVLFAKKLFSKDEVNACDGTQAPDNTDGVPGHDPLVTGDGGQPAHSLVPVAQNPRTSGPDPLPAAGLPVPDENPQNIYMESEKSAGKNVRDSSSGKQVSTVEQVLQPLLQQVIEQAKLAKAEDPVLFLLDWCVKMLTGRMPEKLVAQILEWLRSERGIHGESCPTQSTTSDASRESTVLALSEELRPVRESMREEDDCEEDEDEEGEEDDRFDEDPDDPLWNEVHAILARGSQDSESSASKPCTRPSILKGSNQSAVARGSILKTSNSQLRKSKEEEAEAGKSPKRVKSPGISFGTESVSRVSAVERNSIVEDVVAKAEKKDKRGSADQNGKPRSRMSTFSRRASRRASKGGLQGLEVCEIEKAIEMIQSVPLFNHLSHDEQKELAERLEPRFFEEDQEIVAFGQTGGDMHFVMTGNGAVSVPHQTQALKPGDFFGDQMLVKRHIQSAERITASHGPLITMCLKGDTIEGLPELHKKLKAHKNSKVLGKKKIDHYASAENLVREDVDRDKSVEDVKLIVDAVAENFQLMDVLQLTASQISIVAQEVVAVHVPAHVALVKDGEINDSLFIVHAGMFDVVEDGKMSQKLRNGQCFGELGLLYGSQAHYTVTASRDSMVWRLSQDAFRRVLQAKSAERKVAHMQMLEKITLLDSLQQGDKELLADAIEEVYVVRGEVVLAAGAEVEKLYILSNGSLMNGDGVDAEVFQKGDYFGLEEMALNVSQKGRVYVTSDTASLLTLDGEALELLTNRTVAEIVAGKSETLAGSASACADPSYVSPLKSSTFSRVRNSVLGAEEAQDMLTQLEKAIPKTCLRKVCILGAGSFGLVSLEEDVRTHKRYALKAVSKGFIAQMGMQESIVNEKTINTMLDNPFVVKCFTTYSDDQFVYFLMQPALGGEAFDLYSDHDDWFGDQNHCLFFGTAAALGLDHLHAKKIIYRDLKLENLFLDSLGYPLIADFGLAKVVYGKTYTVCGTADYMAPEMLRRSGHNRAADWWAFGILIFIMMSGRSPFDAADASQIYRNIVKGLKKEHFPDSFSKNLVDVISNLCRKKPEERLTMGSRGLVHLQEAAFFADYDWEGMGKRTLQAPYVPPPAANIVEAAQARQVEVPTVVTYEDDGSGWDVGF